MINELTRRANVTTITLNKEEIEASVDNIYEAISIVAKRSTQIGEQIKVELHNKLEEFAIPGSDDLEEIFDNKEQIEVSKYYESLPKSYAIALQEWLENKIYYRNTSVSEQEKEVE